MADEFDIDDLLEAPYQKVKNEEAEVNMNKVLFCFLFQIKIIFKCCKHYAGAFLNPSFTRLVSLTG